MRVGVSQVAGEGKEGTLYRAFPMYILLSSPCDSVAVVGDTRRDSVWR